MENLLEIKNLRTNFTTSNGVVQAVRGINISLDKGECLGIVGESGCGKSVTMMSILKLLDDNAVVSADEIKFKGIDLMDKDAKFMRTLLGSGIGMVFQDPLTSLNPLYTIGNQIMEPIKIHTNMSSKDARAKAVELLRLVGIPSPESRLKQYPHELSGGMRQRVMIAIAISCEPDLLVADEPTTALDVTIQAQILDLMVDLKNKINTSIILISHDLGIISGMCERVIVMYGGMVMEEGSIDDIFYKTSHPYTKGLLNSIPKIENGKREKLVPIFGSPPDLLNPPKGCPFSGRCDYAMKICGSHLPGMKEISQSHRSACWMLHPKAATLSKGVLTNG